MNTAAKPLPEWKRFRFPQSLTKWAVLLGALWFVQWSLDMLRIDVERLPGLFERIGSVLANRYWPPDVAHVMKPDFVDAIVDTFQMSYVATVVGLLLALPLAWFASFNMTPSRRVLYPVCRLFVMTCRSVHEMIWTIVLLFTGNRGTGKTTELLRLAKILDSYRCEVFYADLSEYLNLTQRIEVSDFLIAVLGALSEKVLGRFGEKVAGRGYFERIRDFLYSEVSFHRSEIWCRRCRPQGCSEPESDLQGNLAAKDARPYRNAGQTGARICT